MKLIFVTLVALFMFVTVMDAQSLDPCADASCLVEVTTSEDVINDDAQCSWREAIEAIKISANYFGCIANNGSTTVQLPSGIVKVRLPDEDIVSVWGIAYRNLNKDLRIKGSATGSVFKYVPQSGEDIPASDFIGYKVQNGHELHLENVAIDTISQINPLFTVDGDMYLDQVTIHNSQVSVANPIILVNASGVLDITNAGFLFNQSIVIENKGNLIVDLTTFRSNSSLAMVVARNGSTSSFLGNILVNARPNASICQVDIGAQLNSRNYNVTTDASCNLNFNHDLSSIDINTVGLGSVVEAANLANVQTITATSPAIDLVPQHFCGQVRDQRNQVRPVDGDLNAVADCDAGAYEFVPENPLGNDIDPDADGLGADNDNCVFDANPNQNNTDGDLYGDDCDNCPLTPNNDQLDTDQNGFGDVCDDADQDGILFNDDNCTLIPNNNQRDVDNDGIGDVCDMDLDGDGILNNDDNCVEFANPLQTDFDGDGIGETCEGSDADEVAADAALDTDSDGVPDIGDNCVALSNADQSDVDFDRVGDLCDPDSDGDGIANAGDNCSLVANHDQADQNNNGVGDLCDLDDDADNIADAIDNCPLENNPNQLDSDADGIGDACDEVDNTALVPLQPGGQGSSGSGNPGNGGGNNASSSSGSSGGGCSLNPQLVRTL